jgi:hypothetical protein
MTPEADNVTLQKELDTAKKKLDSVTSAWVKADANLKDNARADVIVAWLLGALATFGFTSGIHEANAGPGPERLPTPDLRRLLSSPRKTDRLIDILNKNPNVPDGLLNDPAISNNLKKLTDAIDRKVRQTRRDAIQELRDKKELVDGATPDPAWVKKALTPHTTDAKAK